MDEDDADFQAAMRMSLDTQQHAPVVPNQHANKFDDDSELQRAIEISAQSAVAAAPAGGSEQDNELALALLLSAEAATESQANASFDVVAFDAASAEHNGDNDYGAALAAVSPQSNDLAIARALYDADLADAEQCTTMYLPIDTESYGIINQHLRGIASRYHCSIEPLVEDSADTDSRIISVAGSSEIVFVAIDAIQSALAWTRADLSAIPSGADGGGAVVEGRGGALNDEPGARLQRTSTTAADHSGAAMQSSKPTTTPAAQPPRVVDRYRGADAGKVAPHTRREPFRWVPPKDAQLPPLLPRASAATAARHIFIDYSNVSIGAKTDASGQFHPDVRVDVQELVDVLESRGRQQSQIIGDRYVAGSKPPDMGEVWRNFEQLQYTVEVLPRDERNKEGLGVDASIHANVHHALTKARNNKSPAGSNTLVLATGDGNSHNGRTNFPDLAFQAVREGWFVEVWAWRNTLSGNFRLLAAHTSNRVTVHMLDDHRSGLVLRAEHLVPLAAAAARPRGASTATARYGTSNVNR